MRRKREITFLFILTVFGVSLRIFLNEALAIPNFEAVTALSLIGGSFLSGAYGALVPLLIMFLSDLYFGNTWIYLFTWSAFLLIGIFGKIIKKNSEHYLIKLTGGGILSVIFFYLWTNFGWWITSGMYPLSWIGLIQCYIAGIPFLRNQLLSIIIFAPSLGFIFSFLDQKVFSQKGKDRPGEALNYHGSFRQRNQEIH